MHARNLALAFGSAYALVGLLGFLPGVTQPPPAGAPPLAVDAGYGTFMGLFPVNVLHNLVHLGIGLWGMAAGIRHGAARVFGRSAAVIFGLLTIMGLIPGLDTMFGLTPLFGNDVWLHALTTAIAAYIGWFAPAESRHAATAPLHHRGARS